MSDATRKRGISIHLAAERDDEGDRSFVQLSEEQLAPFLLEAEAYRLGCESTVLVSDAGGFHLKHVWFKANYPLVRHSHRHDCMYYVISGSAAMGNRTLRAGDSFFVPSDAPYHYTAGPDGIEILEIRFDAESTDMQVYEDEERTKQRVAAALDANRDRWTRDQVAPTFRANAAAGSTGSVKDA